ncbi:MAG: hypothetical protein GF317_24875, partial [Candidatus Lokiarchaeota archaeon]|nr:hypothetical protein [Candidatus Lokiarchaeota archaeon]MBD3202593.1 hypothetical protein [Candidatus Lokiarchaeota archaeon]
MKNQDFIKLIYENNIEVSILKNSHFSIATSPYYAHQQGLAIDIYESLILRNYYVHSPIEGKVIDIKELKAPYAKFENGLNKEYLILVKSSQNPHIKFKILHINPDISIGEELYIGDIIGKTIRNGYFAYWSSPHIHLEIRSISDVNRAKGGLPFKLNLVNSTNKLDSNQKFHSEKYIPLKVKEVYPEFILASLPNKYYYRIGNIIGIKGNCKNLCCILDGGIPLYKKGIVIFRNEMKDNLMNNPVFINDAMLGRINSIRKNLVFFNYFKDISIRLNENKIRGLSLFLSGNEPSIKLI